ncbi:hypothetical protein ACGFZS_08450 [Streptomyces sp. NPDC048288]|uniref:hypothetical protein n=1 Tax=Streptomyces sp. NPDC048288 TaxID=3365529 RepID=UPI003722801F
MADPESRLRRLVEEGTRAARRPPVGQLRQRARRRRKARQMATVAAVTVSALVVLPLALGSGGSGAGSPGRTSSGAPRPTTDAPSLRASPSRSVPGGAVTLRGTGCAPGAAVSLGIRWERGAKLVLSMEEEKSLAQPQTTARADATYALLSVDALATGSFEATVTIPAGPVAGAPRLWARCRSTAPVRQLTQYISITVHRG